MAATQGPAIWRRRTRRLALSPITCGTLTAHGSMFLDLGCYTGFATGGIDEAIEEQDTQSNQEDLRQKPGVTVAVTARRGDCAVARRQVAGCAQGTRRRSSQKVRLDCLLR